MGKFIEVEEAIHKSNDIWKAIKIFKASTKYRECYLLERLIRKDSITTFTADRNGGCLISIEGESMVVATEQSYEEIREMVGVQQKH